MHACKQHPCVASHTHKTKEQAQNNIMHGHHNFSIPHCTPCTSRLPPHAHATSNFFKQGHVCRNTSGPVMPVSERRMPHPSRTLIHAPCNIHRVRSHHSPTNKNQRSMVLARRPNIPPTTTGTKLHACATTPTHTTKQEWMGSVWATKHNNGGRGGKRTPDDQPLHARMWQCVHNLLHYLSTQVVIHCKSPTHAQRTPCCHGNVT